MSNGYGCIWGSVRTNGKMGLQANNTDVLFVQDLLNRGVPKEDVVLGIHAPALRPYAAFAVA